MTAVIATPPFLAFYDLNGNPLSGGLIYTYAAGTTTPKATFTDESAVTQMSNPIILDSAGRATWWIIGAYKYIVKDSFGNTIATTDNVTSFTTLAAAGMAFFESFSGDGTTTAFTLSTDEGTDSKGLMVFVNSGLISCVTNGIFATDIGWTKGAGWTISGGVATATGAISTAISQTSPVALVQGQSYSVTYTITQSAGTLTPSLGGNNGITRSVAGTYQETIVAGATQLTAFTGAGFTGTLDNVTINVASTAGYDIINPNAYTIDGTALTFAQAPATGTNNIFVFAPSSLLGAASSAAAAATAAATSALTSEAAALASQIAAAISASSAAGYAAAKNEWIYSTITTMAEPGTGFIRFNNATLSSVTSAAISDLSDNSGNPNLAAWIFSWDDAIGATIRGTLYIFKDNGNFAIFNITGANTTNSDWQQLVLTYSAGAGLFLDNDTLLIGFTAAGYSTVTGGISGLTNDITASGSGVVPAILATVNPDVGTFTNSKVTVNAKGLVTAVSQGQVYLNVLDYGASPSASGSANATAFANWWTALVAASVGTAGYIPAGTYNIASGLTWDFVSRANTGIIIYGDGQKQSILNFTQGTGTCLQIEASGGTGPSNLVGYYYNVLRDIGFSASTTGTAFKIGQDNGADSIQGSLFQNLIFTNNNSGAACALRINGATQNTFINIQGAAFPATALVAGSGIGCEIVNAAFNSFISCTFGNANIGVLFDDLSNTAVGFSYSNVFLALDIENVQYCVKQTSPNASRNKFILGEWYTIFAGGYAVLSAASGDTTAGGALIIDDVNLPLNPLYGGGGTSPALDPVNQIGVIFTGGAYGTISTPSFPASTVLYTNITGQTQAIVWGGGTITAVTANTIGLPATINSIMLDPGGTIKFTYTGSPSWYFQNFVN